MYRVWLWIKPSSLVVLRILNASCLVVRMGCPLILKLVFNRIPIPPKFSMWVSIWYSSGCCCGVMV